VIEVEVNFETRPFTLSQVFGMVWNCTDIMPGEMVSSPAELDLKSRTYAAGARAMRRWIEGHKVPVTKVTNLRPGEKVTSRRAAARHGGLRLVCRRYTS
jgi:hypothetical protein